MAGRPVPRRLLPVAAALGAWLWLSLPAPPAGARGIVAIDLHRQAPWLLADTGALGHSELRRELLAAGLRPVGETRPLDRVVPELDPADLLFLSVSKYQSYATGEIAAVASFVENGGKVLLFGEHDDVYGVSSGLQNPMLAPFGMRFAHDCLVRDGSYWIAVSARELGVLGAWFYASPTLEVTGPGARLIVAEPPVVGEFVHPSGGRVVAVADSEFTLNGEHPRGKAARFGIRHGFNRAMALALVRRALTGGAGDPSRFDGTAGFAFDPPGPDAVHVFAGENGGLPDRAPDGFARLLDRLRAAGLRIARCDDPAALPDGAMLLLLHPLSGPDADDTARFGRVAVLGDAWSAIDDYTDNGMLLRDAGIRDPPPPYFVRHLAARGIDFPPGYLMTLEAFREEETAFAVTLPGTSAEVAVKRAGVVRAGTAGSLEVLLAAPPGAFHNPVTLGLDERVPWRRDMERRFYRREDERPENTGRAKWEANLGIPTRPASDVPAGPWALLARRGATLVLADADAVTNRFLADFPGNGALADLLTDFFNHR